VTRYGHIVVAGRTLPIIRLALQDSKLEITAFTRATCHLPAVHDAEVTVFGTDGRGVCQGWLLNIPEIPAGGTVTIILPIQITSMSLAARP
jgi:hypothetical protein